MPAVVEGQTCSAACSGTPTQALQSETLKNHFKSCAQFRLASPGPASPRLLPPCCLASLWPSSFGLKLQAVYTFVLQLETGLSYFPRSQLETPDSQLGFDHNKANKANTNVPHSGKAIIAIHLLHYDDLNCLYVHAIYICKVSKSGIIQKSRTKFWKDSLVSQACHWTDKHQQSLMHLSESSYFLLTPRPHYWLTPSSQSSVPPTPKAPHSHICFGVLPNMWTVQQSIGFNRKPKPCILAQRGLEGSTGLGILGHKLRYKAGVKNKELKMKLKMNHNLKLCFVSAILTLIQYKAVLYY